MFKLSVENHKGEALSLSDTVEYTVFKITGLNPPTVSVNSTANVTSDGDKINSVRVNTRNIVLYIAIERDVEFNRINLYKYFPLKKSIKLYFENDTRKVFIEGMVEVIECDLFGNKQVAQISLICPQPYFTDVDYLVSNFGDITSLFEFPFSIGQAGVPISEITANQRKVITNYGDVESGMIIRLYARGNVVNPILYDVFKGTHLGFNFTMQAGDELIINTYVGSKSIKLIRNTVESNALGYMTPDSDFFTLDSGENLFTYDATSGTTNLQISFTTSVLYGGV